MKRNEWIELLFVILVAVGSEANFAEVASRHVQFSDNPSLAGMTDELRKYDGVYAATEISTIEELELRRSKTRDIIAVDLNGKPFFVTDIQDQEISLEGVDGSRQMRLSVFTGRWNGNALIVSENSIVDVKKLKPTGISGLIGGLLLSSLGLMVAVITFLFIRKRYFLK